MWKWAIGAVIVAAVAAVAFGLGQRSSTCPAGQGRAASGACVTLEIFDPWKGYQVESEPQAVYAQPAPVDDTSAQLRQIQETQHRMQSDAREAAYEAQQQAAELKSEQRTQALIDGIRH